MICPICAETNPDGYKFCGQCGATLDVAGLKLRQQILGVVEREFKDKDLVAVEIADKAEDRLWRWGKVLGFALAIFLAGLGSFGVTSYESAKQRIDDAASVATNRLNDVSAKTQESIQKTGTATIAQLQQEQAATALQMQQQANAAGSQVASVVSRTKANNSELQKAEQAVKEQLAKNAALNTLRAQLPDTPIGNINPGLFAPGGLGTTGISSSALDKPPESFGLGGSTPPFGLIPGVSGISGTITGPYKEGSSGPGVTAIQDRLKQLNCYSGQSSGTFDSATTAAVIAFVQVNGYPPPGSMLGMLNTQADAPSMLLTDTNPGAVDYKLWGELFNGGEKSCP